MGKYFKQYQMKHLFVPYEIAILVKKSGYDEYCLAYYNEIKELESCGLSENRPFNPRAGVKNSTIKKYILNAITAPLYQQVQNWLLKEYSICVIIQDFQHIDTVDGFRYSITQYGFPKIQSNKNFENYYECWCEAIKESIKLI